MTVSVITGDCLDVLRTLPEKSVHCCVTSPPYWGLRAYLPDGHDDKHREIRLEPTPDAYVARMVEVFREVRRVLRDDGTCFLNLGDSYAAKPCAEGSDFDDGRANRGSRKSAGVPIGLKPKDLCGIPWSVAFALRADGWYLRSEIIWAKPNPMPESVTDRPTKSHEQIFLLSKNATYHYDAAAIAEPAQDWSSGGPGVGILPTTHYSPDNGGNEGLSALAQKYRDGTVGATRNKRSVWTVSTKPYSGSHFATFPPDLIEPCILAGCPAQCCAACGAPWERMVEREFVPQQDVSAAKGIRGAFEQKPMDASNGWQDWPRGTTHTHTTGFAPSCFCNGGTVPGTVLDPFFGAGTTGLVADRLQRNCIGIELNPEYSRMARARIYNDAPLFVEVA